jgi:GNAT superfamily N-acetyltransferase
MEENMKIKKMNKSDIKYLTGFVIDYKLEKGDEIDDDFKENVTSQFEYIINSNNDNILVCKKDSDILGYINYHVIFFPMIGGAELYISDLLVDKNKRESGVGKFLLKEVEKIADEKGCKRIMLNNVKSALSYKRSFYEKNGYQERDNIANFVKNLKIGNKN